MIGLLSQSRYGLLSPIGLLFTNDVPDSGTVLERCQAFAVTRDCVHDLTIERINGLGPVLLSVLPLARAARRRVRAAARKPVRASGSPSPVNLLLTLLSALYFGILPLAGVSPGTFVPRGTGRSARCSP